MKDDTPLSQLPPKELHRILRQVTYRGHHWVAKRLGMSPNYIWRLAAAHGFNLGDVERSMRVADLAVETDMERSGVIRRAERDGVLRSVGLHGKRYVVPVAWANELIAERREIYENGQLRQAGWKTLPEAAEALEVHTDAVRGWLHGKGNLSLLLDSPEFVIGREPEKAGSAYYLIEPYALESAREFLDAERHKARGYVSLNSLMLELDIGRHRVYRLASLRTERVKRLFGLRLAWAVPEAVADDIRREVSNGG